MKHLMKVIGLLLVISTNAQDNLDNELPYYEIPDYPEEYTAGTVAARLVDGLGFRYYWATEGLREEDLAYRPNDSARTMAETIDHLYGLTKVIKNATLKQPTMRGTDKEELSFEEKRIKTLNNIKIAADILRTSTDLTEYNMIFKSEKGTVEYPFWNEINGPIADAIWHCGQVVLLRRSSGNPFNSKVSVLQGKVRQ